MAGHTTRAVAYAAVSRGACICAKRSCWEPALRKGRIEHELKTTLLLEDRAALAAYVAGCAHDRICGERRVAS